MSARNQYMKNLQDKVNNVNNLSYVTANYNSYYNINSTENHIGTGRANKPSDYYGGSYYSSVHSKPYSGK